MAVLIPCSVSRKTSPKLREHLASVTALMKASDKWPQFMTMVDRALPRYKALPLFDKAMELAE
jgi:hypothetical protein